MVSGLRQMRSGMSPQGNQDAVNMSVMKPVWEETVSRVPFTVQRQLKGVQHK